MTSNSADIICAVATPPGRAALAVIRVSGAGAIGLVAQTIPALEKVGERDARKLLHDFVIDTDGSMIDEVTAIPYFAPASYTAEEMVEIICHGGYASTRAILNRLTGLGARLAEPGEFTRRAFLNGRISLSEAEAVAAAIEAKSVLALKAAARNLKGELHDKINSIKQAISDLLTVLEAEIDFSDEEIEKTSIARVRDELAIQIANADVILKSYDFGRGLNSGYKIAIVGRTNVGKSSLLNAMLNRDRAIVTDMPGTTRDTLTEWVEIAGFPILLTDTAGIRESIDAVEALGQERTRDEIERSDIVLFMVDSSTAISEDDLKIFYGIRGTAHLVLANKIDLSLSTIAGLDKHFPGDVILPVSAKTGAGLETMKEKIAQSLNLETFSLDTAVLATERQYQAMQMAVDMLRRTLDEIDIAPQMEVIALYLRETLDYLGELVGETTTEDILNGIFGRFCIGK